MKQIEDGTIAFDPVSRQQNANTAYERWINQFNLENKKSKWYKQAQELKALGKNPNPDDVDRIIGNSSWTHVNCDICEQKKSHGIRMGPYYSYEQNPILVCNDCLVRAHEEIKKFVDNEF